MRSGLSAEDLAAFVRLMPTAVAMTRSGDGRFLEVSDAYAALVGRRREELVGRTVVDAGILSPEARASMLRFWDEAAPPREMTLRVPTAGSEPKTAIVQGVRVELRDEDAYLVFFTDISERKRVETELREQREMHEAMLRAQSDAGEAISIVDMEGQRAVYINDALRRMYGMAPGEMGSSTMWERLPPEERERLREDTRRRAERGDTGPVARADVTVLRNDGARLPVEVVMQRLTLHGRPHIMAIVRDLTERKAAEEALRHSMLSRAFVRRLLTSVLVQGRVHEHVVRAIGRELASETAAGSVEESLAAWRHLGVGNVRLVQKQGQAYTFAGSDLLEVQPGRSLSTCFLTLSFLEGAVSKQHQAPALGTEVRCQSRGDEECVFVVIAR